MSARKPGVGGIRKLNDATAGWALWAVDRGMTQKEAARRLGVDQTSISRLVSGLSWQHVPGPRIDRDEVKARAESNRVAKQSRQLTAPKRRKRGTSLCGARIRIGDQSRVEPALEGLPNNETIGKEFGIGKAATSLILREGLKSLHLHLVAVAVERSLRGWDLDALVDVAVYVIEHDLGYGVVTGRITLDEVLDAMDGEVMERAA